MMKESVFVDTDVIIDFLIDREPFSQRSAEVFALGESGKIQIYVSSICFNNIFYILKKIIGFNRSMQLLEQLDKITEILPVGKTIIKQALQAKFADFEDGIQYFTAIQKSEISSIITRNVKDFKKSELPVQTPDEFIARFLQGK